MNYELLFKTLDEELEKIDQYYDYELMNDERTRPELESHKDDLLQRLYEEILTKYKSETYCNYRPVIFIWIKAKTMLQTFFREIGKSSKRKSQISLEELSELCSTENFLAGYEHREFLQRIERDLTPKDLVLFRYKAQGLTYKQIVEHGGACSETAAKAQFHRIAVFIRERYSKLYSIYLT